MITGFLFWGKLVEREGRQEWMKVYVGRIFRIGPVYLLAIIIMFAIVFDRTGFRLHVPSKVLATQMGDWLLLGLFAPSINGSIQSMIALAGVTWTLRYEWFFYFSLPFIAVLARYRWAHLPFSIAGFFVLIGLSSYEHSGVSSLLALFGVGMIAASLNALKVVPKVPNYLSSSLVVLSLITAFTLRSSMPAISSTFLIGFAFYLIASGCTVFGLLTTRAARRLGDISYGIYLLQGIVMAFLFSWGPARKFSLASPAGHWAVALAGALLLIGFAGVAHIFVERPGIRLGRKLISPRKLIAARSAAVL
jgi:peptidoglycan/LPS O-acetylase OafA/YrhL